MNLSFLGFRDDCQSGPRESAQQGCVHGRIKAWEIISL